jgi:hypothetical protein
MKKLFTLLAVAGATASMLFASVSHSATSEHAKKPAAAAEKAEQAELKDGTKIEIKGGKVFVLAADGKASPAPEGKWETSDGRTIETNAKGEVVKQ